MNRIEEIYVLLEQLDMRSIRALRENDTQRIVDINAQCEALRTELWSLLNAATN